MAVDHNNPQSRDEEILIATIDGNEYNKAPQSRMEELLLELKETIEEGGGGGGTTDYENLSNQPQVNGETLIGDKSGADLGLVDAEEGKGLSTNDYDDNEKAAVAAATSAISAMKDGTDLDSFGDVEVALLDKADTADLGTAAAKDSTNAVTAGSTDLVESGAVKDAIDVAVAAAYHHAGTKTVAQLTHDLLIAANEGNVYNITDSGTTTSDFIEGIGKIIDEGSNVGICKVGNTYMFDLLSGFVDTTNFVQKSVTAGLLKNDGTVDTTIQGDVATLKSGLTDLSDHVDGDAVTYPYADVITVSDAVPANLADCSVKVEPVQDLHGYDKPWVGGASKNLIPLTVADIKASNTTGTWSGNVYTISTITVEILVDDANNVIGVKVNGTNNGSAIIFTLYRGDMSNVLVAGGTYTITDAAATDGRTQQYENTFTIRNDWYITDVAINRSILGNGTTYNNQIFYPQLETGDQATTFAPYTNICPISGHTEASVQRDGKNLFDKSTALAGYMLDVSNGEAVSGLPTTYVTDYIHVFTGKTVYIPNAGSTRRCFYDSNKVHDNTVEVTTAFTPSKDGYIRITGNTSDASGISVDDLQIELGSTATPYEPFKGKTYTLALGDTIYGGTVDFDSGVMTVTHATKDLGSLTYTYIGDDKQFFTSDEITGRKPNTPIMASCYNSVGGVPSSSMGNVADGSIAYAPSDDYTDVKIKDLRFTSGSDLKTAITGQTLWYELATSTTVQLTPTQIQLLQGTNTLYASTGDISVSVNGVSGAIGAVQEQVNDHEERIEALESGGSSDDYTNTEQVVGTWMGEPLYRKSYYNASYSSGDVDFNISNIKAVIKIEGMAQIRFVENDYDSFIPIPYINGNVNAENKFQQGPATQTGKIVMSIGSNYVPLLPVKLYMTMYYTKSTT